MELLVESLNKKNSLCQFLNEIKKNTTNICDYEKYIKFDDQKYCKNLALTTDKYDIYVICWKKGQKSKIHNHPDNGCVLKLLKGQLKESKYSEKLELIKSDILVENDCGFMIGSEILHNIEALEESVSVHIYSPPGFKTSYYEQ